MTNSIIMSVLSDQQAMANNALAIQFEIIKDKPNRVNNPAAA